MKKIVLSLLALLSLQLAVFSQTIKDANAQVRDAKNFTAIHISHSFDVYITQGTEEGLAVSAADPKFLDQIKTEVKNGELHIWHDGGNMRNWNTGKMKLKAYISVKTLEKLDVSGACDVFIQGTLKAEDLKIDLSGASDLSGKFDARKLVVDLSGASDFNISGVTSQLRIEASGASSFKGFELVTDFCDARASGASDIRITVNKELSAQASGASDIDYRGEGTVRDLKTSGASSISKKNS